LPDKVVEASQKADLDTIPLSLAVSLPLSEQGHARPQAVAWPRSWQAVMRCLVANGSAAPS